MNRILKIDTLNFDVLYIYNSLAEAARDCGLTTSAISKALKKDNRHAGRFYWCLDSEYSEDWMPKKLFRSKDNPNPFNADEEVVLCLETNIHFKNFSDAAKFYGCNRQGIARCCEGTQKTCGRYHWQLVKLGDLYEAD